MSGKNKQQNNPAPAASNVQVLKPGDAGYEEQNNNALQLFTVGDVLTTMDSKKFERRNMPQLIKPSDVPIGAALTGTIMGILPSPTTAIKGKLMHVKNAKGVEFTFPVTGSIRQALAPNTTDDDKELENILKKEIGTTIVLKREAGKPSKKLGGKEMYIFDVRTSKEYIDGISAPK